jgi:hypothetical protein
MHAKKGISVTGDGVSVRNQPCVRQEVVFALRWRRRTADRQKLVASIILTRSIQKRALPTPSRGGQGMVATHRCLERMSQADPPWGE